MELAPLLVFFRYDDVPGVIGSVGTLFGEAGVNIANMTVSRTRQGGQALMALSIDTPAPPELVDASSGVRRRPLHLAGVSSATAASAGSSRSSHRGGDRPSLARAARNGPEPVRTTRFDRRDLVTGASRRRCSRSGRTCSVARSTPSPRPARACTGRIGALRSTRDTRCTAVAFSSLPGSRWRSAFRRSSSWRRSPSSGGRSRASKSVRSRRSSPTTPSIGDTHRIASCPGLLTMWPEPVERIAAFLRAADVEGRIEELAPGVDSPAGTDVLRGRLRMPTARRSSRSSRGTREVDRGKLAAAADSPGLRPAPAPAFPFESARVLVDQTAARWAHRLARSGLGPPHRSAWHPSNSSA